MTNEYMNQPSYYQQLYWQHLCQLKSNVEYLHVYYSRCLTIDRSISIGLAVLSVVSLALWVVTGVAAQLWALFIVVTAAANVVKPYLPYLSRIRPIFDLAHLTTKCNT